MLNPWAVGRSVREAKGFVELPVDIPQGLPQPNVVVQEDALVRAHHQFQVDGALVRSL